MSVTLENRQVRWAWKKQDDQYIVYSKDNTGIIGVASNLDKAKKKFIENYNSYLRDILKSDVRLQM